MVKESTVLGSEKFRETVPDGKGHWTSETQELFVSPFYQPTLGAAAHWHMQIRKSFWRGQGKTSLPEEQMNLQRVRLCVREKRDSWGQTTHMSDSGSLPDVFFPLLPDTSDISGHTLSSTRTIFLSFKIQKFF